MMALRSSSSSAMKAAGRTASGGRGGGDLFRRQGNGEVGGGDESPFAGDERSLDGVLQLADVSWPRVPPQ